MTFVLLFLENLKWRRREAVASHGLFSLFNLIEEAEMVMIRHEYCRICERETQHNNNKCIHCSERERREEMAKWQSKTTDEKLLDLHKRMLELEAGPPRF